MTTIPARAPRMPQPFVKEKCRGPCGEYHFTPQLERNTGMCVQCVHKKIREDEMRKRCEEHQEEVVSPVETPKERPCDKCSKYTDRSILNKYNRMCEECYDEDPTFISEEPVCSNCHRQHYSVSNELCKSCVRAFKTPSKGEKCSGCDQRFPMLIIDMYSGVCRKCFDNSM